MTNFLKSLLKHDQITADLDINIHTLYVVQKSTNGKQENHLWFQNL